jgi:hypothetical protein
LIYKVDLHEEQRFSNDLPPPPVCGDDSTPPAPPIRAIGVKGLTPPGVFSDKQFDLDAFVPRETCDEGIGTVRDGKRANETV